MNDPFDPEAEATPEENDRNQELLAELGLAVFVAQGIEYSLVNLVVAAALRDDREIPHAEIRRLVDTRRRQTLGKLVKDVNERVDLSNDAVRFLENALPARNWLAHHFYRQYAGAAFSPRLALEATTLLRHARELFEGTMAELDRETTRILGEAGISEERVKEGARIAMQRAFGPDAAPPAL